MDARRGEPHAPTRTVSENAHRNVAFYVHPDRQWLAPLGTPTRTRAEAHRYAELGHRLGGGGIFYVEMENDAPFENVTALIGSIHEFR